MKKVLAVKKKASKLPTKTWPKGVVFPLVEVNFRIFPHRWEAHFAAFAGEQMRDKLRKVKAWQVSRTFSETNGAGLLAALQEIALTAGQPKLREWRAKKGLWIAPVAERVSAPPKSAKARTATPARRSSASKKPKQG